MKKRKIPEQIQYRLFNEDVEKAVRLYLASEGENIVDITYRVDGRGLIVTAEDRI